LPHADQPVDQRVLIALARGANAGDTKIWRPVPSGR
jgi:hypothetical protein